MVVRVVLRAADTFSSIHSRSERRYSPPGQDSWPDWTNLKGLHSGRGFVGNKRFFTCGTSKKTSEKSLNPCSKDSHRLSLLQGFPLCDHGNHLTSFVVDSWEIITTSTLRACG